MSRFWVGVWLAWFVGSLVTFGVLEYKALKNPDDAHPPLTQVIQKYVPVWLITSVIGAFCFWFVFHLVL
jgi:hypothetical protein